MAVSIRVSPDQMRERAMRMRNEADRMGEVNARLDSLLGMLQSEWDGAGRESFTSCYQELKPEFLKMEDNIRELAVKLENYARFFEELDASLV